MSGEDNIILAITCFTVLLKLVYFVLVIGLPKL